MWSQLPFLPYRQDPRAGQRLCTTVGKYDTVRAGEDCSPRSSVNPHVYPTLRLLSDAQSNTKSPSTQDILSFLACRCHLF